MNGLDRQQLFSALILVVMALFVSSGIAPSWRRALRLAAIAGFVVALALALAEIALWLIEPNR